MREPLQKFGFQDSPYERPNQKWVCGKQAQGCPCEIGPDKKGRCRADYQCQPQRKNDRWHCTRSKAFGGTCLDGPMPDGTCCQHIIPCIPVRSIRHKRTVTTKWVCAFTLGVLLLFINSSAKQQFLSPGNLTYQHAQITECSACHEVFAQGISGWIHQAFTASSILDTNAQCLNCHDFGKHAANAHSLPKSELMRFAFAVESDGNSPQYQQIACMNCHVEHHGNNADLLAVNRQNCAYCHDLPFKIGGSTHPDFRHYPYRHRTGIIFDHNQHDNKHFYDNRGENRRDNAPDSCISCHVSDKNGVKMIIRSYKKNCADCHNTLFEESEFFPVITVPTLDTNNISSLGSWPEDTDAELTPFMKLLLSSDEPLRSILSELDSDDLAELEENSAQPIAWGIKELFYDIYKHGDAALAQRLANAYHCKLNSLREPIQESTCQLTASELNALVHAFPLPLFCSAQKEWFPDLSTEIGVDSNFPGKTETGDSVCENLSTTTALSTNSESWSLDYFTLGHRPSSHADDFFIAWLEATRRHQGKSFEDHTREEIFTLLTSEDLAGQCNYCHSMDSDDPGSYSIHWSVSRWNPKHTDFIRFNHAGHLRHQEESVCLDCHQENKEADYLASYEHNKPLPFESNFSTGKEICETCHAEAMTKNQCQICHLYHVSGLSSKTQFPYLNQPDTGHLKIWADKTEYQIGESITVKFSVDQTMYVRIIRIDSSGKLLSLFPNDFRPDYLCKPGIIYQIPDTGSQRTLTITAPAGTDKLLGVGSEKPIPEESLFFTQQSNFNEKKMVEFPIRSTFEINVRKKL